MINLQHGFPSLDSLWRRGMRTPRWFGWNRSRNSIIHTLFGGRLLLQELQQITPMRAIEFSYHHFLHSFPNLDSCNPQALLEDDDGDAAGEADGRKKVMR